MLKESHASMYGRVTEPIVKIIDKISWYIKNADTRQN